MAIFSVIVTRQTAEDVSLEIEADSPEEAKTIALDRAYHEDLSWQINDVETYADIEEEDAEDEE